MLTKEALMAGTIKFGTDGWRGRIAEDYTFANVRRAAQGFARYLLESGKQGEWVVVGHDKRFHSENFAAAVAEERFLDIELESWQRQIDVNLTAYFILARDAARSMVKQRSGVILFTASIDAQGHSLKFTPYCVSKAGDVSLMKSMAVELARSGVRVNSVSPGPADTQQSTDLVGEELMAKWRKHGFPTVPLNRLASVDDIANAFLFLASDDASYITGHDLVVDGGHTADVYEIPNE